MIVREINPIGDSDSATLLISDGTHECAAFQHPCTLTEGDSLSDALSAMDAHNVVRSDSDSVSIRQIDSDKFSHYVVAHVRTVADGFATVQVGDILIDDVGLPGDIAVGEIVEFTVNRLDAVA